MSCQDALPAAVSAAAAAMAQGKSDEEVALLAAIFTPPDALSQILLAVPLVLLFQLGIVLVKYFGRSSEEIDEAKAKQADEEES